MSKKEKASKVEKPAKIEKPSKEVAAPKFNEESAIIDAIVTELQLAFNSAKISSMTSKLKEKFPKSEKALKEAISKALG